VALNSCAARRQKELFEKPNNARQSDTQKALAKDKRYRNLIWQINHPDAR